MWRRHLRPSVTWTIFASCSLAIAMPQSDGSMCFSNPVFPPKSRWTRSLSAPVLDGLRPKGASQKFRRLLSSAPPKIRSRTPLVAVRAQEVDQIGPPSQCVADSTRMWVEEAVIGLNLCPWAKAAMQDGLVKIIVCEARNNEELLQAVSNEIRRLLPDNCMETSLIVAPHILQEFANYMDVANAVDDAIDELDARGVLQLATFHPRYQFGGTIEDDAENWTNRSPFPTFHLIQEEEVTRALEGFSEPEQVWERNIRVMQERGSAAMQALLERCRAPAPPTA